MADRRECPMCGEAMRMNDREIQDRLSGQMSPTTHRVREWVCPECDYFEEAEAGEG
jgi:rubredoxin